MEGQDGAPDGLIWLIEAEVDTNRARNEMDLGKQVVGGWATAASREPNGDRVREARCLYPPGRGWPDAVEMHSVRRPG